MDKLWKAPKTPPANLTPTATAAPPGSQAKATPKLPQTPPPGPKAGPAPPATPESVPEGHMGPKKPTHDKAKEVLEVNSDEAEPK